MDRAAGKKCGLAPLQWNIKEIMKDTEFNIPVPSKEINVPRGLLHVQIDSPTDGETNSVKDLFTAALQNPEGAVVATRAGITTNWIPFER